MSTDTESNYTPPPWDKPLATDPAPIVTILKPAKPKAKAKPSVKTKAPVKPKASAKAKPPKQKAKAPTKATVKHRLPRAERKCGLPISMTYAQRDALRKLSKAEDKDICALLAPAIKRLTGC